MRIVADTTTNKMQTEMNNKKRIFSLRVLVICFVLLSLSEIFFLIDVLADFFYVDLIGEMTGIINHSTFELVAVILLLLSLVVLGLQAKILIDINRKQSDVVTLASGRMMEIIRDRFKEWRLTKSEAEVGLMLIKGYSIQEIADLRSTKVGTIKSHANSVYLKSPIKNRVELASFFLEDLLQGERLDDSE